MIDSGDGPVEKMFECLMAQDWESLGQREVSDDDGQRTSWDIHCVAYTDDRRSDADADSASTVGTLRLRR